MFSLLFHKDIFIPDGAVDIVLSLEKYMKSYFFSEHFKQHIDNQSIEDRSHKYLKEVVISSLDAMLDKNKVIRNPFEIELSKSYKTFGVNEWVVTKYCIRIPYDTESDLVVVVRPQWNLEAKNYDLTRNMIVTAWINHNSDLHFTLDSTKYCSEERWNNL